MKIRRTVAFFVALLAASAVYAQQTDVEVDYNRPRKYIVGGVEVKGNNYFSDEQIIQITGMQKGMELTVPGDDVSNIVKRLWLQRYFEDVSLSIDRVKADSAFFVISLIERPRVSKWTFSGIKTGDQKDLMDRLALRRGGEYSDYVKKTSSDIIKRYYAEKGFLNCKVDVQARRDTVIANAITVNFAVDKGEKVRIKDINFIGNENVKEFKQ